MTTAIMTPVRRLGCVLANQCLDAVESQVHPHRLCCHRDEAESLVEAAAFLDQHGVAAIENIENRDCNAERFTRIDNLQQAVGKEIPAQPLPVTPLIDAHHRYECGRNISMARPRSREARVKLRIIHGMGIERIEADYGVLRPFHDEQANVVCPRQLVRRPLEEIIDLNRATSKRIATVPLWIERHNRRHPFHPHWLEYRS